MCSYEKQLQKIIHLHTSTLPYELYVKAVEGLDVWEIAIQVYPF